MHKEEWPGQEQWGEDPHREGQELRPEAGKGTFRKIGVEGERRDVRDDTEETGGTQSSTAS